VDLLHPRAHALEHVVGLVDDPLHLGQRLEIGAGDHGGDLQHVIGRGVEPRHLEVDPDQAQSVGRRETHSVSRKTLPDPTGAPQRFSPQKMTAANLRRT
jgi:hypothetical protein